MKIGDTLVQEKIVVECESAKNVGSGGMEVFSTPMLVAFMENIAYNLAQQNLPVGETTVGTAINIKHLRGNLIGDKLIGKATIVEIDKKRIDFYLEVYHNDVLIGEGEHSRFIVNEEKFLAKLYSLKQ